MAHSFDNPLLERLYQDNIVTADQAHILWCEHLQTNTPLEILGPEMGFVPSQLMRQICAQRRGVEEVQLKERTIDPQLFESLPPEECRTFCFVPFAFEKGCLSIAMADVEDVVAHDRLTELLGIKNFQIFLASREEIWEHLDRISAQPLAMLLKEIDDPTSTASNPTVRFVEAILQEGVRQEASDIHCEPEKGFVRLRYRCQGLLKTVLMFHESYWPHILVRLKLISHMDIAETRRPQTGRSTLSFLGRQIDLRFSAHPTLWGENVVIRILDPEKNICSLKDLGYDEQACTLLHHHLTKPDGLILVTGPTGSGKTTTLHSCLDEISSDVRNVMTLEDPIEYRRPRLRQTTIQGTIGLTFAEGLRSLLRQDPDVILVGEIRDSETAQMVIRAAMTGHQVLSTLHTPDALSALFRFIEWGISPLLLVGHIHCLVAQRLIRQLCSVCKTPVSPDVHDPSRSLYQAGSCENCQYTGYQGRFALVEMISMDTHLERWLIDNRDRQQARIFLEQSPHYQTLWQNGLSHVHDGRTSLDELKRVLGSQDLRSSIPENL